MSPCPPLSLSCARCCTDALPPKCVGRDPAPHHRWPAGLLSTPAACPCLCVDDAQTDRQTDTHTLPRPPPAVAQVTCLV